MLACGGVRSVCGGNTDAVWDEAEGEAFGGAVGEAKVVMPRVGKCEEGSSVVRGGVVRKGFKANHFREGRDCGWGESELEGLLYKESELSRHWCIGKSLP